VFHEIDFNDIYKQVIVTVMNYSSRIEQALHKDMMWNIAFSTERSSIVCGRIINGFNMYRKAIEFVIVVFMIKSFLLFIAICFRII